jgi:hypothetical protein
LARGQKFGLYLWEHEGLNTYIKNKKVWACPADFGGVWGTFIVWKPSIWSNIGGSYEYNVYINFNRRTNAKESGSGKAYNPNGTNMLEQLKVDDVGEVNLVPVLHDARDTWHDLSSPRDYNAREPRDGQWVVLFADWHAKNTIAQELRPDRNSGARRSDYQAQWWWRGGLRGSPRNQNTGR